MKLLKMLSQYNEHSPLPEQRLFRAIITQALEDADYKGTVMIDMRDKETAINWFLDLGKDFRTTCDYAGFDPLSIRDAFKVFKFCIEKNIFKNNFYNALSANLTVRQVIEMIKKHKKSIVLS